MTTPQIAVPKYSLRRMETWIFLVLIAAIILRSVHYFGRSSMWLDELAAAFNITDRSFYQLATESLDFNQVAPIGFLMLQKIASLVIGVNDHAFRFFPYVFSFFSLFLFLSICRQFLKGIPLFCAFFLFALSAAMVFYSGESKQYSGDVAASLFLVWSGLHLLKGSLNNRMMRIITVGGFILILCSMPAVVIAPFVLLVVLLKKLKTKYDLPWKQFVIIAITLGIACLIQTIYSKMVIAPEVQSEMADHWAEGFPPLTGVVDFITWFPGKIREELSFATAWLAVTILSPLKYLSWGLVILSIPGSIYIFRRSAAATLVLLSPLIVALVLATFRILPFEERVSIYATLPLIIASMAGIIALRTWLPAIFSRGVSNTIAFILALPVGILLLAAPPFHPPYNAQSSQPVLREMKKQMQPGDKLYVYFKSRYAIRFYGPGEGITEYIQGRGYPTAEPLLRDLDSLRGNKRVWFFYTQWTPSQPYPDTIKSYLGSVIGKQIGHIPDPDGHTGEFAASAHLYDLSAGVVNK